MLNSKKILLIFCASTFINAGFVCAETYFCSNCDSSGCFAGEYDIGGPRPDINRCEHLKDYTLSYDSCKKMLKDDLEHYNRGITVYQNGKCRKYQTATDSYGSATCSIKYVITKDGYSMKGYDGNGNQADMNACYKQLENKLIQKQKEMSNSQQ